MRSANRVVVLLKLVFCLHSFKATHISGIRSFSNIHFYLEFKEMLVSKEIYSCYNPSVFFNPPPILPFPAHKKTERQKVSLRKTNDIIHFSTVYVNFNIYFWVIDGDCFQGCSNGGQFGGWGDNLTRGLPECPCHSWANKPGTPAL